MLNKLKFLISTTLTVMGISSKPRNPTYGIGCGEMTKNDFDGSFFV